MAGTVRQSWRSRISDIHKALPHHEMFSTEDDPEGEEHGVEDPLTDVSKQQHPRPVKSDGEPLYWDVDEGHGDAQRKDHSLHR